MSANERFEYHLIAGRVVERKIVRPRGTKRWQYQLHSPSLIAVIQADGTSFSLRRGPAATDDLVVDAVRYYQGLVADPNIPDLGPEVPAELAKNLSTHVADAVRRVTSQYGTFAEETDITGYLKGLIQKGGFKYEDWEAEIKAWTYSRRPKERDLGVDIGLIVDLMRRNLRVLKAMWFQAKKADRLPDDILDLPDLRGQIRQMQEYTFESYALVYTPREIYAFRGNEPRESLAVDSVVYDGLLCRRGDRNPRVVALTGDSKLVVEMLVTGQ